MNVAFAADRRRVAKPARYVLDSGAKIAFACAALSKISTRSAPSRPERCPPRSEILRRDVLAGDFLEIGVHVARRDILAISRLVDILEQLLPGQLLARPNDLRDAAILRLSGTIACRSCR